MSTTILAYISEFTTNVRLITGSDNNVADTISCAVVRATSPTELGINFSALAAAQQSDVEMGAYQTAITGLQLEDVKHGIT